MTTFYSMYRSFQRQRFLLPLLVLLLSILPQQMLGGGQVSRADRELRARQELKDYNARVHRETLQKRARGVAAAQPDVSIRINSAVATSSTIFFYDDFDASTHAWSTALYGGTTDDIWHTTTLNSSTPTHSAWAGVEASGTYSTGRQINTALISPPIDLTGATGSVSMLFAENYVTETGWDFCMVDASTDGVNWTHLRGGYGGAPSGDSRGWRISTLDLTPFANQTIQIRFYFNTGDTVLNYFPGWFVDDIVVFDQGGVIAGRKFFDVNNNGVKDVGERGVKDWTITAAGPITLITKTGVHGHYRLPLPLGTYTVSETFEPNWTQKYPLAGTWNVTLATPDTLIDSLWFGNYTQASFVNGVVFHDLNNNATHDGSDTLLPGWMVEALDTAGNVVDYDITDSVGTYQLYIYQPGTYTIVPGSGGDWIQTVPPGGIYTLNIPDLNTVSDSNNFGFFFSPTPPPQVSEIRGWVYDDRNRNHVRDSGEGGIFNVELQLLGSTGNGILHKVKSDSSGYFRLPGITAGGYRVREVPFEGWWQSQPESLYVLSFDTVSRIDTIAFGNYQIAQGSISGTKYHDINRNAVRDSAEEGLSGWHILLGGMNYFGQAESRSVFTDGSGGYTIGNLWPGTYNVSEVWKNGWTQTAPGGAGIHIVALSPEENRTGVDFGNIDSAYLGTFRTFRMDSIAYALDLKFAHKPIAAKPTRNEFTTTVYDTFLIHTVKSINITLTLPYVPGSLTASKPGTLTPLGTGMKKVKFTFDTDLVTGDSLVLRGVTLKIKPQNSIALAFLDDLSKGGLPTSSSSIFRLPMPNALDVVQNLGAITVGLGAGHSVVMPTWKQVVTSLFDKRHGVHIGDPRCLDKTSTGASIKKRLSSLPPQKHNNALFAELLALRINIMASDMGKTPAGLGNLVYDDGTDTANPMNGLTLREIAAKADSFMSSYRDTIGGKTCLMPDDFNMDPDTLYARVRQIDSVFSGPIDTVVWSGDMNLLLLKGVRPLSDAPFLRFDASKTTPLGAAIRNQIEVPNQYTLYQNYPNPFNPTTTLSFYLTDPSIVTLKVFNLLGQEVATVVTRQMMDDGFQEADFNASALASGVYFYQLKVETMADPASGIAGSSRLLVKKMVLMK